MGRPCLGLSGLLTLLGFSFRTLVFCVSLSKYLCVCIVYSIIYLQFYISRIKNWSWWLTPTFSTLGRLMMKENCHEFEASLGYRVFKTSLIRDGEMAQSAKCYALAHEDLYSIPSIHFKKRVVAGHSGGWHMPSIL